METATGKQSFVVNGIDYSFFSIECLAGMVCLFKQKRPENMHLFTAVHMAYAQAYFACKDVEVLARAVACGGAPLPAFQAHFRKAESTE